jgi:ADP-heptose:LPS heptosyltransferase
MTPALRDLHHSYPNEFETSVLSCYPEIFHNNLCVSPYKNTWGLINLNPFEWKNSFQDAGFHYTDAYYFLMEQVLNIKIKKTSMFPEIFLSEEEKKPKIMTPYWVINAGMKNDMPLKQYPLSRWELVVQQLRRFEISVVQSGHTDHIHSQIPGALNMIGKTNNMRDYFSLIYNSLGVICHVSFPMHIAAAFRKPCVVIGGGRENPRWEMYPGHTFLSSVGYLDCCRETGCWLKDLQECKNRKQTPACYDFIGAEDVVSAVMNYH